MTNDKKQKSMDDKSFHSGFVAIIGRPNVGKSTLLNRIIGEKIAITSAKPQTTRNRIQGIRNLPGAQIIFIDTPGIHKAHSLLNTYMVDTALASLRQVDVVVFLVEATDLPDRQEPFMVEILKKVTAPVILAVNKIDTTDASPVAERLQRFQQIFPFKDVLMTSALRGSGVEKLVESVARHLPEGPMYFPDDILTDLPERFIAAEIIREKIFRLTRDELPYSTAVEIDSFKEGEDIIRIAATITVEKDSQKGIVIGRGGSMLKKIGTQARQDLERLLQSSVYLELFVRVRRDWSEDKRMLKELGYE
jgi:GTP-binding protein Era